MSDIYNIISLNWIGGFLVHQSFLFLTLFCLHLWWIFYIFMVTNNNNKKKFRMEFVKVIDNDARIRKEFRKDNTWYWNVKSLSEFEEWGDDWPFLMSVEEYKKWFNRYVLEGESLIINNKGGWLHMTKNYEIYEKIDDIVFPNWEPATVIYCQRLVEFFYKWGKDHQQICEELYLDSEEADKFLCKKYIWLDRVDLWVPKKSKFYTNNEEIIVKYLKILG